MTAPFSPRIRDVKAHGYSSLNRYWSDRDYMRRCDAENEHTRKLMNDEWDARLIATDNRFPSNWTPQEKQEYIERMMK